METPILVVLGIAALLAIMYFFGGSGSGASSIMSGGKKVRFSSNTHSCSGDTCSL